MQLSQLAITLQAQLHIPFYTYFLSLNRRESLQDSMLGDILASLSATLNSISGETLNFNNLSQILPPTPSFTEKDIPDLAGHVGQSGTL
jgi:hypothetical protein